MSEIPVRAPIPVLRVRAPPSPPPPRGCATKNFKSLHAQFSLPNRSSYISKITTNMWSSASEVGSKQCKLFFFFFLTHAITQPHIRVHKPIEVECRKSTCMTYPHLYIWIPSLNRDSFRPRLPPTRPKHTANNHFFLSKRRTGRTPQGLVVEIGSLHNYWKVPHPNVLLCLKTYSKLIRSFYYSENVESPDKD